MKRWLSSILALLLLLSPLASLAEEPAPTAVQIEDAVFEITPLDALGITLLLPEGIQDALAVESEDALTERFVTLPDYYGIWIDEAGIGSASILCWQSSLPGPDDLQNIGLLTDGGSLFYGDWVTLDGVQVMPVLSETGESFGAFFRTEDTLVAIIGGPIQGSVVLTQLELMLRAVTIGGEAPTLQALLARTDFFRQLADGLLRPVSADATFATSDEDGGRAPDLAYTWRDGNRGIGLNIASWSTDGAEALDIGRISLYPTMAATLQTAFDTRGQWICRFTDDAVVCAGFYQMTGDSFVAVWASPSTAANFDGLMIGLEALVSYLVWEDAA